MIGDVAAIAPSAAIDIAVIAAVTTRSTAFIRSMVRHGLCSIGGHGSTRARCACSGVAVDVNLCDGVRAHPNGRRPADQLLDAATSAAANYRASSRARSRAEFVAKLGIVSEEIDESVYCLEILKKAHLGDQPTVDRLLAESKELRSIFAASYRTARRGRGK